MTRPNAVVNAQRGHVTPVDSASPGAKVQIPHVGRNTGHNTFRPALHSRNPHAHRQPCAESGILYPLFILQSRLQHNVQKHIPQPRYRVSCRFDASICGDAWVVETDRGAL